jgi:NTE family protein
MLQALLEAGIEPDLVLGSSIGALNGSAVAALGLKEGVDLLTDLWVQIKRKDVFPGGWLTQFKQLLSTRLCLFSQDGLESLLNRYLPVQTFDELALPLGVMVTELLTHRENLLSNGQLVPSLLASAAIPGVYPPVTINGVEYIDGGLVANVPMKAALMMGAKSIVVLDTVNTCLPPRPRHIGDLLRSIFETLLRQRAVGEAPLIAQTHPVLYLCSPCPVRRAPFNFDDTPELIDMAAEAARSFLSYSDIPRRGMMSGGPSFYQQEEIARQYQVVPQPILLAGNAI